ncbi:MAG: RIP metalloprotease RseP [Rhodospirillales bacterium]|nr:RIP metalloprotease RseP [Rhodospirillales bacterium]MDE2198855.1 RIP metalloprotease RseP [Rhodospirillales bacterium]MDE2574918.1 RIP metalloprotease RseP [Rhodospirillales bacterium]
MPAALRTPVSFVVVLGILVFIHELGHYLAARWRGVHVEAFSIGFGSSIFGWTDRHGTAWKVAWIPLGGYVKLHGQERAEEASDATRASWIPGRTFHEKSVLSRAIIIAAGPVANFVLAAVLFIGLFAVMGQPVAGSDAAPVVGEVVAGTPAALGGLQPGDVVSAIGAEKVTRFADIQRIVSTHPGDRLTLHIMRAGQARDVTVTAESQNDGHGHVTGLLGIRGGAESFRKMSVFAAVPAGLAQTWLVGEQTLAGVWEMMTRHGGTAQLGGPVRIAELSGQVAALGLASLVSFIAVLSVNLGLINLFPIPVLDGGHLMFLLAEALRGRPLPIRAQEYGFRAGFALLIGLFVFATWNDLAHIGLFRWVAGLLG